MRFDLVDLRLFVNVCNAGSITGGAANSCITLQSASERIKGIEDELGTSLLVRSKTGVITTEVGRVFLQHAINVLQDVDCMRDELFQYSKGLHGHILLACNSSALNEYLPSKIATFLKNNPHISFTLQEKLSLDIVRGLKSKTLPLGIVSDSVQLDGLQQLPFCDDELVVIVHQQHCLGTLLEVSLQDIVQQEFIGLLEHLALQQYIEGYVKQLGKRLNYRVRMSSFDAVYQVVANGVGIAIVPRITAQRLADKNIRIISLKDNWAKRKLVICTHSLNELPQYYRDFIGCLTTDNLE
ncbi:LysR substrate-binding domain-containing protein [Entomomonas asaccharolytica]|uniref:LysR family transcriptional regulator n=1 Tax=Entomomonas asaccharolytica TaxID=2785331 RepID=A0A974NEK0_9GAMM|nr:LysR substrate-binding domain-containing protein [Entomomonas asaccharolytica]QQP84947.1 LysR family transcriptional regulator [Entomomonas asaccharolytica]